jgi:hypothetical protein
VNNPFAVIKTGSRFLALRPHPHQCVQKIINSFLFFRHAAFYSVPQARLLKMAFVVRAPAPNESNPMLGSRYPTSEVS